MSQTYTGSAHAIGTTPVTLSAPFTVAGWGNFTVGQARNYVSVCKTTDLNNTFTLGTDRGTAGNQMSALIQITGNNGQVLGGVIPSLTWCHLTMTMTATTGPGVFLNGGSKNSTTGGLTPAGVNGILFSGRPGDFSSGAGGQFAHWGYWNRVLSDLEVAYIGAGGNPRWLTPGDYWKFTSGQSPVTDEMGLSNLTVTSATAGTSDPTNGVASYWTAAAFGNQTHTQGSAISAVNLTTKFDQMAASVDYTSTLKQLSAPGSPTTATAAGTASNLLTVASVTGFAVNGYASVTNNSTPTLILAISGTTLLLGTPRTWSASNSVYPFTVNARTFTGGPVISANSYGGTPASGDVGTFPNCFIRAANTTTATLIGDSPLFSITVASSGTAASFSAGPTLTTANADGYTFGGTSTQTATWWQGVYLRGSAAPTATQIIAGTGTGFVSHFSTALTLNVAGSNTSTGLILPDYDLYHCLTNGNGNSAVTTFTDQFKASAGTQTYWRVTLPTISAITKANPAQVTCTAHGRTTGDWVEVFQVGGMTQINSAFTTCTVVDVNNITLDNLDSTGFTTYISGGVLSWGQSIFNGASTAVATGDIAIVDSTTLPDGLPVTLTPSGAVIIQAGTVTRRQTFSANVQSVSLGALIGVTTDYFQNIPPLVSSAVSVALDIDLPANQTIAATNLVTGFATSPQGDPLTLSLTGLPAGLTLSSPNISGTTGAASLNVLGATYTDAAQESSSTILSLIVGNITPPNFFGLTQGVIQQVLQNIYLNGTFTTQDDPNPLGAAQAGTAISQNPPFPQSVVPHSTLNITLSSGKSSVVTPITPVPPVLVGSTVSTELQLEEQIGRLNQFPVVEAYAVCAMGATDPSGTVYRFLRIPSGARIMELLIQNDPNPAGTQYICGLLVSPAGSTVVSGSDSLLFQAISFDAGRSTWTNLFTPAIVKSSPSVANVGLRVWELLGLPVDPSSLTLVDVLYDVAITALTAGTSGGTVAMRIRYLPAPPRGLATAPESPW